MIGNIWSDSWQSPSCRDTLFYGWLKKQEESHILRIKDPLLSPCGSVKEVSSKPWHGTFIPPDFLLLAPALPTQPPTCGRALFYPTIQLPFSIPFCLQPGL